ncbi:tail fiber assembly protein [Pectobacterium carotovorum]|uniref:tail fiber assembly protein n=1 Tax=Pectobacterium carotovorum TaxID=554 RepID=UPI0013743DA8|nr:tail fiber assembly protein [Pectobacterium carotovorum]QHP58526.1 tail fiber assembly protein [Pectobacterium carotovorum subsp. carotovorum]
MKYSAQVKTTELNEKGLAIDAGWITVYQVNQATREYQQANYEYLMRGVGVSAGSYVDEPEMPEDGNALCRSADGKNWEHIPDYRGQRVYSTETRLAHYVNQLGELPSNVTLLEPTTEFDVWNGKKWVTDVAAQKVAVAKLAQQQLASRKTAAAARINELTYAVNLDIATDAEKAALIEWQRYAVLLSRVDVNAAAIEWPEQPA